MKVEQRVFIVKTYFETKKLSEVGQLFSARFPDRQKDRAKIQFGTTFKSTYVMAQVKIGMKNIPVGEKLDGVRKISMRFKRRWEIIQVD